MDGHLNINGLIGSTIERHDGLRLLIEQELGDGLMRILELPSGNLHRPEDPETGTCMMPDVGYVESLFRNGDARIVADPHGPIPGFGGIVRALTPDEILAKDPYAEARQRVLLELVERGVDKHDPDLSGSIDEIWKGDLQDRFGERPATSTVRSWFERTSLEVIDVADLMRMSGRVPRRGRLDPELEAIYQEEARRYYGNRGLRIVDATAAAMARVAVENERRTAENRPLLSPPNRETMRRRIDAILCRETYAEKWGEDAARRKWDGSGRGLRTPHILRRALMDDTVVDAIMILDQGLIAGRPYLVAIIDVHSRVCLGLVVSFVPPSLHTAALCLRRANRPKTVRPDRLARYPVLGRLNGKPAVITTDNGSNYVSPAFGQMCANLGIKHELVGVKQPRAKAIIERFFHTLNTFLVSKLPGATLDPSIMRKLGLEPEKEAVMTLREFEALLEEFLFAYHVTLHSGIGCQPALAWERSMRVVGRNMILDERRFDAITGVTIHGRRLTANGGFRMLGLTWKSDDMVRRVIEPLAGIEPHRRRLESTAACTATVLYDPADLSCVHVRVGSDLVRLDCTSPEYATGLTLWHHEQLRAFAKREALAFNTEADRLLVRDQLNRAIRETFPDLDARERRAAARLLGPAADRTDGAIVEHAVAVPRHDGLGPIIENDLGSDHRDDMDRPVSRPDKRRTSVSEAEHALRFEDGDDTDERFVADRYTFVVPPDDDRRFEEFR